MRKQNALAAAGKAPLRLARAAAPAASGISCHGPRQPLFFLQGKNEVILINEGGPELRRVHLNVPHSANPKISPYGESVGHYEGGDTLMVDTIGLSDDTCIDNYRTPHTTQLHVVERFKVTNDGKTLEVTIRSTIRAHSTCHGQRGRFSIARAPGDWRRPSARKTISPSKGTRPSLKSRRPTGRIFDAPPAATFTHFDRLGELAGWANGALFAPRPRRLPQRWSCFPLPTLRGAN
jgi:hypothetical protein